MTGPTKLLGVALAWLALMGVACGYRENGESCWNDDQCASDHCAWGGRCEPGLWS
jgi:hypothetical protein